MCCSRKRGYGSERMHYGREAISIAKSQWKKVMGILCVFLFTVIFSTTQTVQGIEVNSPFLSERERELIVRAVAAECSDASYGVQVGLAGVVLRRLESGRYGDDAASVIYTAGFLRCTKSGRIAVFLPEDVLAKAESAVETALLGGDPTNGALYFASPENHMTPPTRVTYREGGYIFGKR